MAEVEVLEYQDEETDGEKSAREELEEFDDEFSQATVDDVIDKLLILTDELSGLPLYGYQTPIARRIFESLIIGDGETITALISRQAGKSEVVSNTIAVAMIFFPALAKVFPDLMGKFSRGFWVGCFGPTDEQAEIVYSRIVSRITSETAQAYLSDPDIDAKVSKGFGNTMNLSNGSLLRRQTAHPRSNIEGRTYHLMLIDEAQAADAQVINKSIVPMGSATNATIVMIGTPTYTKGEFYKTIQINKRAFAAKRGRRQNHFEADWREVSKWNKNYKKFVSKQMLKMGEDSDEFRLSYRLHWILDKGMFTTSERIDELGDKSMEIVHAWHRSPVVVGIDPARKMDSTIVTVVWVDWDHPDEFGYYNHRILNWLDLASVGWEEQYARIVDFLSNYSVFAIGVDSGGLGDPVISRLRHLMPHVDVVEMPSDRRSQSTRWKNFKELLDRGQISWPAHAKIRTNRSYRRFIQQLGDLEIKFEGPYVMAQAPRAADAHDDYIDSLSIACMISGEYQSPVVEQSANFLYSKN